jgi:hypothetical protein
MTGKIKRGLSVFCLVAAIFLAMLLPGSSYGETLRFVFLADSRANAPTTPNPAPTDLINTPVLTAIRNQILALSPPPAFVIFGGDMAYRGCYNGTYTFQAWKDLMAPLPQANIPVYTALGNHELYNNQIAGFVLANQQQYQQVFTENPTNGPPGYQGLVYSFASPGGDCFFAVLDPYYLTANNSTPNIAGTIDNTQFTWLTSQVAQTQASHKFLFTHAPYYYVTSAETPTPADTTYTYLWSLLDTNSFNIYFCGHTHLYSRKTIDSSIQPDPQPSSPLKPVPDWKNNVVQVLNGTCGAPVDTGSLSVDPTLWHVSQVPNTYYFSVVDISGSQVTVNTYGGNTGAYSVFDTFTINNNSLRGVHLLLMD